MAAFRPARDGSRGRPGLAWKNVSDGTPDFLRLTDPADRAAFRQWFTLITDPPTGYAAGGRAFRVRPGSFEAGDATDGAVAQFADAKRSWS